MPAARRSTLKPHRMVRCRLARRQAADIIRLKSEGVKPSEIAGKLRIGRASVYRVLGSQQHDDAPVG